MRDSVQREKRALLDEIARVQTVMQDAKQVRHSYSLSCCCGIITVYCPSDGGLGA